MLFYCSLQCKKYLPHFVLPMLVVFVCVIARYGEQLQMPARPCYFENSEKLIRYKNRTADLTIRLIYAITTIAMVLF